ncbi:UNVERIFIED_CONTAM: hypothetical protein Slati_1386000 [Sesamum latifolium]|uniref:Uncharacterized protein n=1 Tax=Sesamum latifolium TaxID=2727402 RepID=A0AAW2X3Z3_9LAMI
MADPPRHSTSSDTSAEEISLALLGAIQQIVSAAIREQVAALAPARIATPSDVEALEEEPREAVPVPPPPTVWRLDIPSSIPQEFPAHWLAHLECLQKGLQDVQYQIGGAPEEERQGVPFTEFVMADELPMNCRTPAITEYDGTTNPVEYLAPRMPLSYTDIQTASNVSSLPPSPGPPSNGSINCPPELLEASKSFDRYSYINSPVVESFER